MLIVSQNRERVINLSVIECIHISGCDVRVNGVSSEATYTLGQYASIDRAKAVLKEIVDEYYSHTFGTGGVSATLNSPPYIPPFGFTPPKVYYMPEE